MPGSFGTTNNDDGVVASTGSSEKTGVFGRNDATNPAPPGVGGNGVFGLSLVPNASGVFGANNGGGTGVFGESANGDGVVGASQSSAKTGVFGKNDATNPAPPGVGGNGVFGLSLVPNASGVFGANNGGGTGVFGESANGDGVVGASQSSAKTGVFGKNDATNPAGPGVGGNGVFGLSAVPNASGVFGENNNGGIGVAGFSKDGIGIKGMGKTAGRFEGDVEVTGNLSVAGDVFLSNNGGDIAERFPVASPVGCEPGMVMAISAEGNLVPSNRSYDRRAIGVIAGGGPLRPAMTLDPTQKSTPAVAIAIVGTVYCMVDADLISIEAGDLLTSSPTTGHAMKAVDPVKSFGAVIGKALASLSRGRGLIPAIVIRQ